MGPLSGTLGQLAATMSSWAQASEHFEAALRDCARANAQPSLGWTQADYARMLLRRADPGDRQRALELLDEALITARELGMKPLEQTAVALREPNHQPDTPKAAR
jgi:uncharacterized protein HemY